jgi:hypothetical protein
MDTVLVLTKRYLDTSQVLTKGFLDTVQPITQGRIVQLLTQNNLAAITSVVGAFKKYLIENTENSILQSCCSKICQVTYRYKQNKCVPLDLPNNRNYTQASAFPSIPVCNRTGQKCHISKVDHSTMTT